MGPRSNSLITTLGLFLSRATLLADKPLAVDSDVGANRASSGSDQPPLSRLEKVLYRAMGYLASLAKAHTVFATSRLVDSHAGRLPEPQA
jgi:hypothetical protein